MTELFAPYDLAGTTLANRIVMAPMTRSRNPDLIANALTAQYYAQRASAGLIVTEGTPVTPAGQGYIGVPGIWSAQQTAGWQLVTDAVHAKGGRIFAQIWHVGRMSHSSLQPDGGAPVSASAVPVAESPYSFAFITLPDGTPGRAPPTPPRAMQTDEVAQLVQTFADAGANAVAAGFDGVEIHAANGYLFEQFLNPNVNQRQDQYGGSRDNRLRFTLEVVDALVARIGADKVGIRLAPNGFVFDMQPYPDNRETYLQLARELDARGIAYLHLAAAPDAPAARARLESELGDLLFVAANLARHAKVDVGGALRLANHKFERRFRAMEALAVADGTPLPELALDAQEALWARVKASERAGDG